MVITGAEPIQGETVLVAFVQVGMVPSAAGFANQMLPSHEGASIAPPAR
ncbi:MAG TPA: hypothetical protein VK762_03675 [Polyangiaceae bacterium]|jgi:hypothetical protein|nr:hypothetical protein [Polyangiaceae bacterium]